MFREELKPLFSRLSDDQLLNRCLLGLTQNQNEAINGVLCPKSKFCGKRRVETAVCEAICHFNTGMASKGLLLDALGMKAGMNMLKSIEKGDRQRIKDAESKISVKYRSFR